MSAAPFVWAAPWMLGPLVAMLRWRNSRSLNDVSAEIGPAPPMVSVIIPARNERRNIERCLTSILRSDYPRLEVIVVDDQSSDGTGRVARQIAAKDGRASVIDAPHLPDGWFGKQWACTTGASSAHGDILVFTDADTVHEHDLLNRAVNALRERHASLLSVAGHQEMHSFWERVIQPQLFALLLVRYGGTEHVSNARRPADVIANGQFIVVRRDAYLRVGGHERVRDRVAEDMALAQEFHRAGGRVVLMVATDQFSTHMYSGLSEIINGWRKNIYAGGRSAALGGSVGRAAYPAILLAVPAIGFAPPAVLLLAALGLVSTSWLTWSAICVASALCFWTALYRFLKQPAWYALLYPLGCVMLAYIAFTAIIRGQRVAWKQREYISA